MYGIMFWMYWISADNASALTAYAQRLHIRIPEGRHETTEGSPAAAVLPSNRLKRSGGAQRV